MLHRIPDPLLILFRYQNFTYGKKITQQYKKLCGLHENMQFKGGPTDRAYMRKVLGKSENRSQAKSRSKHLSVKFKAHITNKGLLKSLPAKKPDGLSKQVE